ncbi:hypothetical protein CYLTODRAFT_361526 [Cylindrobasidium torrendii FP15055 ss-10]|uniref:RRM domain-containing protein n=1 Tax=Cylindrobasidium torrendii FP15055 ss-10 TaxID=1314674 RepID=A0A0D7AW23_9AGAR|nr:hypothetical protein CYLTODRAFT_361526 [Cylindrobasidium torrendii FP15055 ss-10]
MIKTRPARGGSRKGGNNRRRSTGKTEIVKPLPSPASKAKAAPTLKPAPSVTTKIIVSNLPSDVTESQVRDLFVGTVGPVREIALNFDSKGNSKGIATIIFSRNGDGNKAFQKYNNRLIDGS